MQTSCGCSLNDSVNLAVSGVHPWTVGAGAQITATATYSVIRSKEILISPPNLQIRELQLKCNCMHEHEEQWQMQELVIQGVIHPLLSVERSSGVRQVCC